MSEGEKNDALALWKRGWTADEIGEELGRDPTTIYRLINELKDTTELGAATLRKNVAGLVQRLVDKAEPAHIIDILSRPNIGILEPVNKGTPGGGSGGGSSIVINVQPNFLAAVGEDYVKGLRSEQHEPELPTIEGEVGHEPQPVRVGKSGSAIFSSVRAIDGESS